VRGVGAGEQEVAGAAGALQGLVLQVGYVAMLGRELDLAELAAFGVRGLGADRGGRGDSLE